MSRQTSRLATALYGRWLLIARVAWLAVTLLAVGIFVAGLVVIWPELSTVCTQDADICAREGGLATPEDARDLRALGLGVGFYAFYDTALNVVFAAVWWAVAALIYCRRSDDPMALLVALFLVTYGPLTFGPAGVYVLAGKHPALWLGVTVVQVVGWVSFALFFCLFPSGRFVPRWSRWLVPAFLAVVVVAELFPDSALNPLNWLGLQGGALLTLVAPGIVAAQVYRYKRVSGPVERQQTKWVVYGVAAAFVGFAVLTVVIGDTAPEEIGILAYFAGFAAVYGLMLLIPLSIGVAVLRSRLYEIDVVINRTLVYGSLTATLVAVYFGGVATTQAIFRSLTGQVEQPQLAVVVSTLAIAALFNPLRRRIQTFIDRRFYRRKYDARKTLEDFSVKLREETDLDALNDELVGVVSETMQPAHVSLWLRPETASKEQQTT